MPSTPHRTIVVLIVSFLLAVGMHVGVADTEKDFFQNSDLTNPNNYNPAGSPSTGSDILLTTSATGLMLNAASLNNISSLNQTNSGAYTISNNSSGSSNSSLAYGNTTNTIGADPFDVIYLGGSTSSLTLQGPNGGTGSGALSMIVPNGGNFDVAQPNATLNISASVFAIQGFLTKTGAGTLNVSNNFNSGNGGVAVQGGTMNILPGASLSTSLLQVNNGTLNIETSITTRGLDGTGGTANLMGSATVLNLGARTAGRQYSGDITGNGSVSMNPGIGSQEFAGHNTYAGATTITSGTLMVDGSTSGQGNYSIFAINGPPVTTMLGGSGTIGLAINGTITVGGSSSPGVSTLTTGSVSSTGTLHVTTSGTGKIIFADNSTFLADIGAAGASDLLSIAGGKIDLTSSHDTLSLNSLNGAFDGSNYTIATFDSTANYGVFNTVTGLPSGYEVVYDPTDIMLVDTVPEPATWAVCLFATGMLLHSIWRRSRQILIR